MIFIAGNVPSSKNSKRWTGKMLINSKTVMKYIKDTDMQYKTFKTDFKKLIAGKELPVIVSFKFIRGTRHRFDYVNPAQTVQDLMVKYDWLEDDSSDHLLPMFDEYEYSKDKPGVLITIKGKSILKKLNFNLY